MDFKIHPTPAALAPYIHCYWTLTGDDGQPQTIFPDGRAEIVIQRADPFTSDGSVQPRAIFVGQMSRPVTIAPTGRVHTFGIRFRPTGAHALLQFPQFEAANRILSLDAIDPSLAGDMEGGVESALLSRLGSRAQPAVDAAIRVIAAARGSLGIDRLAASLNITRRQLERIFQERVGIDPKTFARIVRFQSVLNTADEKWADIAAAAGYFDQAHLIRDFRQFSGETPAAWGARRVAFLQDRGAWDR